MATKYTKWSQNMPNGRKIDHIVKNIPNSRKISQHLPFQDPPKLTQIGIFGLKIHHLATLYVPS
jgi:hypothetical protein